LVSKNGADVSVNDLFGSSAGTGSVQRWVTKALNGRTVTPQALSPLATMTRVQPVFSKKNLVTQILVMFSGPVDPVEVQNAGLYHLVVAGKKGSFTAKNAKVIKLRSVAFNSSIDTVTLTPRKPFKLSKPVQLQVNGLAPSGLQDSNGRPIDGDHDGQSGGDAVAVLRNGGEPKRGRS
jgi:hypothetical protein